MNNIIDDGEKLLGDLSGYARLASLARQLKQDLITWRKDKFLDWCQDTSRAIDDPSQALRFGSFFFFGAAGEENIVSLSRLVSRPADV